MSSREYDRPMRLVRVRLVAYDYLTPTQQHRSLALPDLTPTPLTTVSHFANYGTYVQLTVKARKQPLRRIVLLYD